jgi:hypothetical protein
MSVTLTNSSAENWRDRPATDFYPTPPAATQALIDFLTLPKELTIWEPACGDGRMVDVLQGNGYTVRGTDIQGGANFLETKECPESFIITNPPFCVAEEFIRHANKLKPKCGFAFLLKSQYWHAAKRLNLFREIRPQFVLPLAWRPDFLFKEKGGSPTMDVLWTVWLWDVADRFTGAIYEPLGRPKRILSQETFDFTS